MTPEEAAVIIDRWAGEDRPTIWMGEAVDALETIANMTTEYAIEHQTAPRAPWQQVTKWSTEGHRLYSNERIIVRYVTAPQPLEGEHP